VVFVALATASVGCEESTTYVGVSYGYPGWGGPCCWGGPGWGGGGVYMGGPVWGTDPLLAARESPRDLAAVDDHGMSRDVRRLVRSEKGVERCDLRGGRMAAKRDLRIHGGPHLRRVLRLLHRRPDVAGTDSDDADRGRELERHRARQLDHAGLRGVVVGVSRVAVHARGRAHVCDDAAAAREHAPRGLLGHVEHTVEVDTHHPAPFLGRDVQEIVPHADP